MPRFNFTRFEQACKARKLSTEKLARLVGCSASYLFQVRRARVPSAAMRARVASVLAVAESELWGAA